MHTITVEPVYNDHAPPGKKGHKLTGSRYMQACFSETFAIARLKPQGNHAEAQEC